jgi:hypothetical protein
MSTHGLMCSVVSRTLRGWATRSKSSVRPSSGTPFLLLCTSPVLAQTARSLHCRAASGYSVTFAVSAGLSACPHLTHSRPIALGPIAGQHSAGGVHRAMRKLSRCLGQPSGHGHSTFRIAASGGRRAVGGTVKEDPRSPPKREWRRSKFSPIGSRVVDSAGDGNLRLCRHFFLRTPLPKRP